MSFLSRMRLVARPLTRRAANWDSIARVIPASKQAEFSATVAAFNKRKEKALSATEDSNIDFGSYVEILGADEVNAIKAEYEAHQYSNFESEKEAELADLRRDLDSTIAQIEEQSANLSAAAAAASEELVELERTRTTLETSIDDVLRRNPEIANELAERLENEDWDTEAKQIDITAMRLDTIKENWDSATLGSLDEDTQKAFLEEIHALEQNNATTTATEDLPEHLQQYLSEWHTLLGRTEDPASLDAFVQANRVTDADLALRNERELWTEIDMATELCMFDRAQGLIEHAKGLKESGELEIDEQWRATETRKLATARIHQDYNTPVSAEEVAGKSADELTALADSAAEASDYYRAAHFMYHARVASGDVNPDDKDLNGLSGFANHFHKVSLDMAQ